MGRASPTPGYPLKFRSIALEKVWGGRRLESVLGKSLPGRGPIGEIWGVWDGLSIVNGSYRGKTLAEVVRQRPSILGGDPPDRSGRDAVFPLLIKFLDASENLSIQVHPDDDYAQAIARVPFGKCEMWYILSAEPGAVIYHGPRRAITRAELSAALGDGSILDLLERVEVHSGEVILNPPGTIHALGAGIVLYELQQSCDVTYRLYDWDRGGADQPRRELHLDHGSAVSDLDPPAFHQIRPIRRAVGDSTILGACRSFAAELWRLDAPRHEDGRFDRFEVLTALSGSHRLASVGLAWPSVILRPGDSALLPAGLGDFAVTPVGGPGCLVRSYVPDLARDIVHPLLASGIDRDSIIQLGGDPRRSDLRSVVSNLGPAPQRGDAVGR